MISKDRYHQVLKGFIGKAWNQKRRHRMYSLMLREGVTYFENIGVITEPNTRGERIIISLEYSFEEYYAKG